MSKTNKEAWRAKVNKFLIPWRKRKDVIGALACGSIILGTANKHSDLDLHIVLAKGTKWRERGNCIVDGLLIEYLVGTATRNRRFREEEFHDFSRCNAAMYVTGEIIFDKTGEVARLKKEGLSTFKKKFRKLSNEELELAKYSLWDKLDELRDLWDKRSYTFVFAHSLVLAKTIEAYHAHLGISIATHTKIDRYFDEKDFVKRYRVDPFPDKKFVKLFTKALRTPTYKTAESLVLHVLKKMGGFKIDGWKVRSKD